MAGHDAKRKLAAVPSSKGPSQKVEPVRRLDGDDLFAWAGILKDVEIVQSRMQAFVNDALARRGLPPSYGIDGAGYILSPEQVAARQERDASPQPRSGPPADEDGRGE